MLNDIITPQFIASTGVTGTILLLCIKALQKVYNDMRADAKAREERLMAYLDQKAETDRVVSETLKSLETGLIDLKGCFYKHTHEE